MESSQRVIVNTIAQYTRTFINICLSLYSTRLVLEALGQADFGLFSLVGGVVAMLGFITNAMIITTQRFLSYYHGKGSLSQVKLFFTNSLMLHFLLGILLVLILNVIKPLLFHQLNIDAARMDVASDVYVITTFMLFFTFMTATFRALLIARENIVFISIVDVLDGVIKLSLVLLLLKMNTDKLLTYSLMLLSILILNMMAFAIYTRIKYEESTLFPKIKDVQWGIICKLFGFAGWTTYSTGCIIVRNQGVAVILNSFLGTVINSAYGIAMQVSGATNFVGQAILNAMSPRVIQAEGKGDRRTMLSLAGTTSKFCFLLLSMIAIPLIFEMDSILCFWLGHDRVPDNAKMFCQYILLASVCDQLTVGLGVANQAIGRIRNYSLLVNTTKVLTLLLVWICLYDELPLVYTMWSYLFIEVVCVILRLFYLKYTASLSIVSYTKQVLWRVLLPFLSLLMVGYWMVNYIDIPLRFIVTIAVSVIVDAIIILTVGLEQNERTIVLRFCKMRK